MKPQDVYDAAEAANAAAWTVYDASARDPRADDRPAWAAYCATLTPLHQAARALTAPQPIQLELFGHP